MKTCNWVSGSLLTLSLFIAAGSLATHARDDQNAGGKQAVLTGANVAVVDMERVFDASDAPDLEQQKGMQTAQILQQRETRIASVPLLEQTELGEYINLIVLADPTPVQQTRIQDLKTLSDRRAEELTNLRNNKAPTPVEQKRMRELQTLNSESENRMAFIDSLLKNDRQKQLEAYHTEQMNRLRTTVVAKVAASHGILNVFNSEALVYSVNDITAEVIQKLGKHK